MRDHSTSETLIMYPPQPEHIIGGPPFGVEHVIFKDVIPVLLSVSLVMVHLSVMVVVVVMRLVVRMAM
jgi:hypothetical protein